MNADCSPDPDRGRGKSRMHKVRHGTYRSNRAGIWLMADCCLLQRVKEWSHLQRLRGCTSPTAASRASAEDVTTPDTTCHTTQYCGSGITS